MVMCSLSSSQAPKKAKPKMISVPTRTERTAMDRRYEAGPRTVSDANTGATPSASIRTKKVTKDARKMEMNSPDMAAAPSIDVVFALYP